MVVTIHPGKAVWALEKVYIDVGDKYFQVSRSPLTSNKEELLLFLARSIDVFPLSPYEAPGVDPEFIYHWLNVDSNCILQKKKLRRSPNIHSEAVQEEVDKLKEVRAIKEVFYPKWLANTVIVKKKIRKWWVCVDFTYLNKACQRTPTRYPR